MPDFVTILQGQLPSCKRVTPQGVEPAAQQVWFRAEQACVQDLTELAGLLDLVSCDPRCLLVRGSPKDARIRRTHVGPEAYLTEQAHHWLALDLDSIKPDLPAADFASDPGNWAEHARDLLPDPWRKAACWFQATGSAGIKPGIRLRLVFWLDEPATCQQAKALARSLPVPVDLALYTPSQPHYTSPPVFAGVPDPIIGPRSGLLPGLPSVVLPTNGPALGPALSKITRAPEGERRNTLNAQAFMMARTTDLPLPALEKALTTAGLRADLPGPEVAQTVQAALRDGRGKRAADMDGWRADLARDKSGEPRACHGNTALYLLHHPTFAGKLAMDGTRLLWTEPPPWADQARPVADSDEQELVLWFQSQADLSVQVSWCSGAMQLAASRNQVCEVQVYLQALPEWDGQVRVDTFFVRHWGVPDSPLIRAQSRIWFVQAARRAWATLDQPVNAQYMIVLQGKGGLRKSLGLRALCPKQAWFRDLVPDLRDKDSSLAMLDSWIVELAELTHKRADQDVFKAFLTRTVEKFRPPYGRQTVLAPRRCALIGTCNEVTFLSDPTGNRRFWPMTCTRKAELPDIESERDQLWAEAQARRDEQAWLPDALEDEAADVQDQHRDPAPEDLVQERVLQALQDPRFSPDLSALTASELAGDRLVCLSYRMVCALAGLDPVKSCLLVGRAMGGLGWSRRRMRTRLGSAAVNRWLIPEDLQPVLRAQVGLQVRA